MPLAAILGICLLLSWPRASVIAAPQSQESQPSNTSQQDSTTPPPSGQQNAPHQPAVPPESPPPATQPCSENSQPGSSVKSDCKPTPSTETKNKKHHHKADVPKAAATESGPTKKIVPDGGAEDPIVDLSPGLSPQQASHQKETDQLLAASDANLQKLAGRQLNPGQQDTVKQIKDYMVQAKTAEKVGDVQRAHNLAVKASLLSADLVGPEKK